MVITVYENGDLKDAYRAESAPVDAFMLEAARQFVHAQGVLVDVHTSGGVSRYGSLRAAMEGLRRRQGEELLSMRATGLSNGVFRVVCLEGVSASVSFSKEEKVA